MDPRLFLKPAPELRLVMTFALRQALEILQMPQMELGQWLEHEIEKNPLLEISERRARPQFTAEIPSTISLHEHLLNQIRENFSFSNDQVVAKELLQYLDEKGFIAYVPQTPNEERILKILQTFDPPGIFAKNLQETFLLQLKASGKEKTHCYRLVQECFDDLLHGRYTRIKKKLNISDLTEAMQVLTKLSLRPASAFKQDPITAISPDILIEKIEGGWTMELIEDDLPKFQLKEEYLHLELESAEEKELMRGLKTEAKWIFRSLSRRRKLLREIGRILIRKQSLYLSQKGPLAKLTTRELSEKLKIHESTLSRALHGKYVSTPRGTLPLRSLLSASPTSQTARDLLEVLVNTEDKTKPYTDEELAKKLQAKGYPVARRTVSKYRTQLKIGSATQRKHLK